MRSVHYWIIVVIACAMPGCSDDESTPPIPEDINFEIPDWTEPTHGNDAPPDYAIVFPQQQVNTLEIKMTEGDWAAIQADMRKIVGSFGGGVIGGGVFTNNDPRYVGVSMKFNGREWYKAGFRLKGNSTLGTSWRQGIYKLPFRLNMDYFEDIYPQIKNQRFYGFKELSMSPSARDNSLIREKVASDIFHMAGIPCSKTSFYKVYIDFGAGLKYCGVYTMVEVVDDTMVKDQFGEDDGNIYKPESALKNFDAKNFEKKNHEDENDFSDIQTFIAALNSSTRTTAPPAWRATLDASFNTDHFLRWLAANTVMLNWDTYGRLPHNYYLYHHSTNGLTWIPWDNNEAMSFRGNNQNEFTMSLNHVSADWPLIRNLIDDPEYNARYREYVASFAGEVFTEDKMFALLETYHGMIAPYVVGPEEQETGQYTQLPNPEAFAESLDVLKQHVVTRRAAAAAYLE